MKNVKCCVCMYERMVIDSQISRPNATISALPFELFRSLQETLFRMSDSLQLSPMESNPSSSSPPLQRSLVNFFEPFLVNPSKTHKSSLISHFFFVLLFFLCYFSSVNSEFPDPIFENNYISHCNNIIPLPEVQPESSIVPGIAESLQFQSGYYSAGDRFFDQTQQFSINYARYIRFRPRLARKTVTDGIFEVRGLLHLSRLQMRPARENSRNLRGIVYRQPRISSWNAGRSFALNGFWSESSGRLCMVGSDSYMWRNRGNTQKGNAVLKLNYLKNSTIFGSLISGTLKSYDDQKSSEFFEPISILALSHSSNYKFTLMGNDNGDGCLAGSDGQSLSLNNFSQGACTVFSKHADRFDLEYGSQCHSVNCNPLGADVGNLPESMYFYGNLCTERQKVQVLLGFLNSSYHETVFPFHPNTTLISEGIWNEKENQLCGVACRILNSTESLTNAYVGDCSIKFTLRFPTVLSLRNRSTVLGQIWTDKAVDKSGYFNKIGFKGSWKVPRGLRGFQYKYTEISRVKKSCAEKNTARGKVKMYPDGHSSDMKFSMFVRNSKGQVVRGYSSPLFVDYQLYDSHPYGGQFMSTMGKLIVHTRNLLNVSYTVNFKPLPDFMSDGELVSTNKIEISAEGIYNENNGLLCMIGCRHLRSTDSELLNNGSMDCEIMINVEFPPLNARGSESITGTIKSMREKSDPFYFQPLQLSSYSIYKTQAEASIWRMDFEVIMVIISNTIACVFVGLQLLYVKKNPDVLPSISITMLIVLTLGHMIPLLLNFEALFTAKHSQESIFLGSAGWLEVKEVIVRIVKMVAFLLQLRLLQLTWSSRQSEERQAGWWVSERKVLSITLPLYISGILISLLVHIWKVSHQKRPFRLSRHRFSHGQPSYEPPSLWEDFRSYAGLLLDGFLLPQILFNLFFNSEGKALALSFYIGTTIVRILPHAYDFYRAHSFSWYLDLSYIYASHMMDFYSPAWDIIIPCGGLIFVALIYFQQRFGGRCILPKRYRESSSYEKVPVIGNDDL